VTQYDSDVKPGPQAKFGRATNKHATIYMNGNWLTRHQNSLKDTVMNIRRE
jgi:hypothetical protein